jgi:GT2 family glycosyltransferase/tetratricopeptide (TPR) repeat protein/2-polyprenyl-3-methyl-5-hydroxy-6-metoxy-1,4-benzoquinol methylase
MAIRRVAIIFDSVQRPETTGGYCLRALQRLVEVVHFQPSDLDHIPRTGFDLYLNIDDGLRYHLPSQLHPSAWWAIDTHMDLTWCLEKAWAFDHVFAAQRDGAEQLRRGGIRSAAWLPLACDPDIHAKHDVAKQYDVAFVGNVFPGPRAELLELIRRRYQRTFVGQCYFAEMARTYSAARTVFNRSIKNDVNMRVFEAVACGSLLLTNDLSDNGQAELFRDGVHLATFREPEDLLDKIAFYLDREPLRETIAAAGRAEALEKHTYRHRMEQLLRETEPRLHELAGYDTPGRGATAPLGETQPRLHELADCNSPGRGAIVEPRVLTRGTSPEPSFFPPPSPGGAPQAGAEPQAMSPRGGSAAGDHAVAAPAPTANAVGFATPPHAGLATAADPFYYGHARPEVVALIPETARTVLDVGCGAGRLGEALKARQQVQVVGIELNEAAAAAARQRLDQVFTGDVERLELPLPPDGFDAIVCADILEHLRDPDRMLRQALAWLAPDGRLVASIPNVRHHSVIRSLLEGNWTYESAGLLDRDHVRFFTRREIEKLFFRAGFTIEELRTVVGPGDREAAANLRGPVQLGRLSVSGIAERDASEFYTYQYLVRARPARVPDRGVTSIVIVTHNQLEYTRMCLDSLRRLTDEPCELIVVDNGSSDGTVEYVSAFQNVRLIVNDSNRGFPAAANQGIRAATGSQIVLLNNDVVVTTGWLCRLLRALYSDPAIGLVGPCSNFVSGPQQVEARYDSLSDLDGFAWDWGGANDGRIIDDKRLVGFCLLIRRDVAQSIGLLDEQFGVGCFDDDDYCLRAIQAGYRAVIAADAFVHHFGGRTFMASGVDFGPLMRENERRFREKWAGALEAARDAPGECTEPASALMATSARSDKQNAAPHPAFGHLPPRGKGLEAASRAGAPASVAAGLAIEAVPGGGLRIRRKQDRPRLSLCMIVRDSARTLPAALESIRPWVDEMVIVDTGSLDETPRIAEWYGGRLLHFPWPDSFSVARNESLRHAQGDWLFWMDSDDTIPPECGRKLRRLIDRDVPSNVVGFVIQVHCPGGDEDGDPACNVTMVDHVKLFRNRPELRFDGRIHEQILPAIRASGGEVAWTDIYVVHSGSDQSRSAQEKKRERDLRLLHLELAERPEHPFTLFNLGMTHVHGSHFEEAVDYLRRGIARSGPEEAHLRKAFALLVYALMRLGRRDEALSESRRGREMFPCDVELRFREGVLLHELGRLHEARRAYLDALTMREERHFTSVVPSLSGFSARQNLAVVAADLGDLAEAERRWREVIREVPQHRVGWRGLAETMIRGGRLAEADAIAEGLLRDGALRIEGLLIKSRAAQRSGRLADARAALDRALAEQPDDLETLRGRCQFLFDHGEPHEAEAALRSLIARAPHDGAAHHNLGTLLMRARRFDDAVQAYHEALRSRPNYAPTFLNLGYALKDCGRLDEARSAWQEVLRLAPGHPTALHELGRGGET